MLRMKAIRELRPSLVIYREHSVLSDILAYVDKLFNMNEDELVF